MRRAGGRKCVESTGGVRYDTVPVDLRHQLGAGECETDEAFVDQVMGYGDRLGRVVFT
jgi:hypothetical protein